jgi:DNA-binding IclR family transcriptional regulator
MDTAALQAMTPTERLIAVTIHHHKTPTGQMTLAELASLTGASAATLSDTTQRMVRQRLLIRTREGGVSRFRLPMDSTADRASLDKDAAGDPAYYEKFFGFIA